MKLPSRLFTVPTLAVALLVAAPVAFAQPASPSLLGKSFGGADITYTSMNGTNIDSAHGVGILAYFAINPTIDGSASYDFSRVSESTLKITSNTVRLSVLNYTQTDYGKPYFVASIGHGWDRTTVAGVESVDNGSVWSAGIGLELLSGRKVAVDTRVTFNDSFSGNREQMLQFGAATTVWITDRVAGRLSLSYDQINHNPDGLAVRLGIRWLL